MKLLTTRRTLAAGIAISAAVLFAPKIWAEDPAVPTKVHVKAEMNAQALSALLRARVPLVVLDTRGAAAKYVPGAKPCPPTSTTAYIASVAPRKNMLVVVYGSSSTDRNVQQLADRLANDRYPNVVRFTGGIQAWTQARLNFAVRQPTSQPAPQPVRPPAGSGHRGSGGR